ncbi:MAG: acetyl-CoA acetyltransferase [Proteobacteria bacterium]|nr:acetyl-CoA acetyltransferase [Pseudomonadota bacterium]
MSIDPRTPVLVGAAAVQQREEDPERALEPVELMALALERAARDAVGAGLLERADAIRVPRGFWDYPDPGRILAGRLGADAARTQVAEVGILQTSLFGHAARDIAAGHCDVVLLAGGEAKFRSLRAEIAGGRAGLQSQPEGTEPDEVLRPGAEIMAPEEIAAGLTLPVAQYSLIENALRFADGQSLDAHRDAVAELWAGFAAVAAGNPGAWNREGVGPREIRDPSARNRMLAFPYTKLHSSQWNVDQAAGLILCSLETARRAGVPEERWVFPLAVTESNHMVSLSQRAELHRSPGFEIAGRRAFEHAGADPAALRHVELYSCFPSAVRVQARELGVPLDPAPTLTGGMTFGGGPLNNFVLQAACRMAGALRESPGSAGLLTAVSGLLTKQGVSLWSTEPPAAGFRFEDVSAEAERRTRRVRLVEEHSGEARVASYTVQYEGGEPARGVLLCDLEEGLRCIAETGSPEEAAVLTREEFCGRKLQLRDGRL